MISRWLAAALLCALPTPAPTAWHSVLQVSVGGAPAAYQGPGDIVASAAMWWGLRGYTAAFSGAVANICDAATGLVCADVTFATVAGVGTLTMPLIGGLACNNVTNICQIKTLYDQSGALACAGSTACDVTQATAALRPTLVVAGAANGCPSTTMPCVSFVAASTTCLASATPYTRVLPISAAFVGIRTGNTSAINAAIGTGGNFALPILVGWSSSADTGRITAGSLQTIGSFTDSTWHAVQSIWSNTVGAFSFDGSTTAGNNGTNAPSGHTPVFGGNTSASCANPLEGKLTEGGMWPLAFSAQNISDLNANAHSYWGF